MVVVVVVVVVVVAMVIGGMTIHIVAAIQAEAKASMHSKAVKLSLS